MMEDREERIRELLPLVRQIARRVHRMVPSAEVDDLVGDGSVGLIRAVDAFDPKRGVPLAQYARRVVLGAMLNGIRKRDPVTERVRRTMRIADQRRFMLANELGTLPTLCEMEQRIHGLRRARAEAHRMTPLSLDVSLPCGLHVDLDLGGDPQVIYGERSARDHMLSAIESLPPRQRRIVLEHYFAERSLRSLSEAMTISPQRASQLHLLAVKRLRAALAVHA
jgi:RNA polymerase sigma factor for flagellar operon FliA